MWVASSYSWDLDGSHLTNQPRKEPGFLVEYSPDYGTINVDGFVGGHRLGFFEAIIYSEESLTDECLAGKFDATKIKTLRTLQTRLVINPFQAKALQQWLSHHIGEYEKAFGKIPEPEGGNLDRWK